MFKQRKNNNTNVRVFERRRTNGAQLQLDVLVGQINELVETNDDSSPMCQQIIKQYETESTTNLANILATTDQPSTMALSRKQSNTETNPLLQQLIDLKLVQSNDRFDLQSVRVARLREKHEREEVRKNRERALRPPAITRWPLTVADQNPPIARGGAGDNSELNFSSRPSSSNSTASRRPTSAKVAFDHQRSEVPTSDQNHLAVPGTFVRKLTVGGGDSYAANAMSSLKRIIVIPERKSSLSSGIDILSDSFSNLVLDTINRARIAERKLFSKSIEKRLRKNTGSSTAIHKIPTRSVKSITSGVGSLLPKPSTSTTNTTTSPHDGSVHDENSAQERAAQNIRAGRANPESESEKNIFIFTGTPLRTSHRHGPLDTINIGAAPDGEDVEMADFQIDFKFRFEPIPLKLCKPKFCELDPGYGPILPTSMLDFCLERDDFDSFDQELLHWLYDSVPDLLDPKFNRPPPNPLVMPPILSHEENIIQAELLQPLGITRDTFFTPDGQPRTQRILSSSMSKQFEADHNTGTRQSSGGNRKSSSPRKKSKDNKKAQHPAGAENDLMDNLTKHMNSGMFDCANYLKFLKTNQKHFEFLDRAFFLADENEAQRLMTKCVQRKATGERLQIDGERESDNAHIG